MSKFEIVKRELPRFSHAEEYDWILRIDHERTYNGEPMITEVVAFEWHSVISRDALGNTHRFHGMRVPVRSVWNAIDAFGAPTKAIRTDGTSFWIMNSYYNRETGKCIRLVAGNSSEFTVISR